MAMWASAVTLSSGLTVQYSVHSKTGLLVHRSDTATLQARHSDQTQHHRRIAQ
jgi:hypothetical protein